MPVDTTGMKATRSLLPLLACLGWLLSPSTGLSEGVMAPSRAHASAGLDFRIVIPPMMRVLENSHPHELEPTAEGGSRAQQRLVVVSNMKRGFCASLRLAEGEVQSWRLQSAGDSTLTLQAVAEGYRICATRPGRFTLVLHHAFDREPGQTQAAISWPVRTDLTAL